jgi:hypothetical protein
VPETTSSLPVNDTSIPNQSEGETMSSDAGPGGEAASRRRPHQSAHAIADMTPDERAEFTALLEEAIENL